MEKIKLKTLGDERGSLIALEDNYNVPFNIQRVYYIFDTKKGVERGFHAHMHLKQLAIAVKGSCTFILDNSKTRKEITLDDPGFGILIEGVIWREMKDFSSDCVLLVLASEPYDEKDYIRDYQKFMDIANDT
jgi:dTDP-4-dehydrorhamnose 3,5-epimerase-like enzyme